LYGDFVLCSVRLDCRCCCMHVDNVAENNHSMQRRRGVLIRIVVNDGTDDVKLVSRRPKVR